MAPSSAALGAFHFNFTIERTKEMSRQKYGFLYSQSKCIRILNCEPNSRGSLRGTDELVKSHDMLRCYDQNPPILLEVFSPLTSLALPTRDRRSFAQ
jgi:hypothetical protein